MNPPEVAASPVQYPFDQPVEAVESIVPESSRAGQFASEESIVETGTKRHNPKVLMSRTTPNQNSRNALRSLVEQEMLAEFWTTFAWNSESAWNLLLPRGLRTQLARRSISEAPACQVRTVPWREMVRLGSRGTPFEAMLSSGERPFSNVGVALGFDAKVARRVRELRPNIVYSYDGIALQTFREAGKLGIATVSEQSSSHWRWTRKLFGEEASRNPEFAGLLPNLTDSAAQHEWADEELRLADYVFVPSEHVLRTLAGVVPEEKIRVIPYGAPEVKPRSEINLDSGQPLKVLFAGSLIQRKGIGYLLEAAEMLGSQVELTLLGGRFRPNVKVDQACQRWNWIETLPHAQVLEVMQQADVLVLPSLSEGCALVVLEALACGLPVIVTPNTGSLGFVRDGQEGFVVPICQGEAIAERLEFLGRNREVLAEMSRQAQATAAKNSWKNYRANWARAMGSLACF